MEEIILLLVEEVREIRSNLRQLDGYNEEYDFRKDRLDQVWELLKKLEA